MRSRQWYLETIARWMAKAESYWDPERGVYGRDVRANAQLLPALVLLAQAGDVHAANRARDLVRKLTATPPWDPEYHYFSDWDALGAEPHGASAPIASGLSFTLRYADDVGLEPETRQRVAKILQQFSAKFAARARPVKTGYRVHVRHVKGALTALLDQVGGIERYVLTPEPDDEGYLMVTGFGALHTAIVEKGLQPDFRYFEFWGPDNQECWVMRSSAYAYLATGDQQFLDDIVRMWTAVIERVDRGCGLPYRGANGFVEDFSFHYSESPLSNYEMSVYDLAMMAMYADVIRIQRMGGLQLPHVEEFFRRWAHACQTRSMLCDGTSNPVLNLAGWERAWCIDWHTTWVWPLIALPDLSLLRPEEIKHIVEVGVQTFDERLDSDHEFPLESGLVGYSQATGRLTDIGYRCYEVAQLLLTEPQFFEIEPRPFGRTLSSLAWKDRFFVIQNPTYILTIIGAGPGYDQGHDHGTPCSGGEYHLQLPFGPSLTPLSDHGRPSVEIVAAGEPLSSSQVCIHRLDDTNPQIEVRLPDGRVLNEGEAFGDLLYDPMAYETLQVRVTFGNQRVRVERQFHLNPDRIVITDTVRALRRVIIDRAMSRVPLITINPRNEVPRIQGLSGGRRVELFPPFYMCIDGACHKDRTMMKSLTRLDTLRVAYRDYGFVLNQLSPDDIQLDITNFEWLENRRMRVAGKNLDYVWIFQSTVLEEGEKRCFQYEILPFSPPRHAIDEPLTLDSTYSIDDDA